MMHRNIEAIARFLFRRPNMPFIRSPFRPVFILILLAGALTVQASDSVYMQVPGIKGESTSKNHPAWINVSALSGCISNAGGTSKAGACDISITKDLDLSTTGVYSNLLTGKGTGTSKVLVDVCGTSGTGTEICYYKLQLRNVRFTSAATSTGAGNSVVNESWSMTFDAISWTYTPGWWATPGTPVTQCWDFTTNTNACP
jgi:type VI secretion system secreted protein Hcp